MLAEIFENCEMVQFVIRSAARRSSGGANYPNRLKRGREAKQEVLCRLVWAARNENMLGQRPTRSSRLLFMVENVDTDIVALLTELLLVRLSHENNFVVG